MIRLFQLETLHCCQLKFVLRFGKGLVKTMFLCIIQHFFKKATRKYTLVHIGLQYLFVNGSPLTFNYMCN